MLELLHKKQFIHPLSTSSWYLPQYCFFADFGFGLYRHDSVSDESDSQVFVGDFLNFGGIQTLCFPCLLSLC